MSAARNLSRETCTADDPGRHRLLFVSDLELRPSGGGSYAVNWHAHRQLQKHFSVTYGGPLVPRPPLRQVLASKVRRRLLRRPGRFACFSPETLDRNAAMVAELVTADHNGIVFRSATRWCRYQPRVPYFVYLDAVFHTFFHNTFRPSDFVKTDLERIWREEADFLEGAAAVFFESRWGLEKAREAYGLQGGHYFAVGRGGVVEPPGAVAAERSGLMLLTMAMKFRQKGGDLVLEAYRRLKPRFPGLSWHIIGAPPEGDWKGLEGIVHEGVLRPDNPADGKRLRDLLSQAFLLLHPTREDVNPLVPTEAAYFGCPCISVNRFALPELVLHGETGLLLDPPVTPEALTAAIAGLLENQEAYRRMRVRARDHALQHSTWDRIGDTMASVIRSRLQPAT